jgi:hypothetical protein
MGTSPKAGAALLLLYVKVTPESVIHRFLNASDRFPPCFSSMPSIKHPCHAQRTPACEPLESEYANCASAAARRWLSVPAAGLCK